MKIYFKGLFNKKIVFKYIIIFGIIFLTFSCIKVAHNYISYLNEYNNHEISKELLFYSYVITDEEINVFSDCIESYTKDSDEMHKIVFCDEETKNEFYSIYQHNISSVAKSSVAINETVVLSISIMKVILYILGITLCLLIILFNFNFFISANKNISLYNLLGFSKSKVIFNLFVAIYIIYFVLYIVIAICIKHMSSKILDFNCSLIFEIVGILSISAIISYIIVILWFHKAKSISQIKKSD